MKKNLWIVLMSVMMCSCGIYNKYERPNDIAVPLTYRDVPAGKRSSESMASLSWQQLFTDTCLQNLIREGIAHNTELNVARQRIEQSEAVLLSSKLSYLPSLSAEAEGALNSFDASKASKTYTLAGLASWEVDIFGKATNAKREAKAELEKDKAYAQAVQTQLIASIADSYYMLLTLDKQQEIHRRTLKSWERTIHTQEALKRAGESNDASVLRSRANYLELQASLSQTEQSIHKLENSLSVLIGVHPRYIRRSVLENPQFPKKLSVGVPLQLLDNRPDVRQAEMELAKAFYATNGTRAAFYPSLTLNGSAGWSNNAGGVIVNPAQILLSGIGSLTQPLFNKGQNIANLRVAKAEQEIATLNFRQVLLEAGQEVNDALTQCQMAKERAGFYQGQIDNLREVIRKTELLMKHSSVNYLEVLTAQQALHTAELAQVQNLFEEIQGRINLYHALGGGVL